MNSLSPPLLFSHPAWAIAAVASILSAGYGRAQETFRVNDAASFNRAMGVLKPGDRVILAPGDYNSNFFFGDIHGTAENPILIVAADPKRPPRFVGRESALHLTRVSHVELRDLVISGSGDNGLNIDNGRDTDPPADHVVLRNIRVHDIGPKGNSDGIKLSGLNDFQIIDCTVERWGRNGSAIDMVGCHRGVILGCTFRKGGENAVQTKGGSADVNIRRCLFEDAGDRAVNIGGITGFDNFRPPLTTFPLNGRYEAKNILVEGCTFIRGEAAIAFVGVDGAMVRYNTIYQPQKYAIRILQEQPAVGFIPCRKGVFENNIVVFRSDSWADGGVNIGANTAPKSFKFRENLWYCEDQPGRSEPQLPVAETDGIVGKDPRFANPARGDFALAPDSPARGWGAQGLKEGLKEK